MDLGVYLRTNIIIRIGYDSSSGFTIIFVVVSKIHEIHLHFFGGRLHAYS